MNKKILKAISVLAIVPTILLTACGKSSDDSGKEDNSLQKVLDSKTLVLGLDATFKPMGFTDTDDNIVGFDIDVAEEVAKKLGVDLVKRSIDWDMKEQELKVGNIDCVWNGMSVTPSRAEEMNLSDPYMENEMVFVVRNDSGIISQADLEGKSVAVQAGSSAETLLKESEIGSKIKIVGLKTNIEGFNQLDMKMVEAVFGDSVFSNYEIQETGKEFTLLEDGLESEEYAIGFRKNDQALRDEIQSILSELKADGTIARISTKWFGKDVTTIK